MLARLRLRLRLVLAIAFIALLGFSTVTYTLAQPPEDSKQPPEASNLLDLPDLPKAELRKKVTEQTTNPQTQQRILQALDGGNTGETGDPVLDDVLQIIKRRGSILDGSGLDAAESELGRRDQPSEVVSQQARAAESLLKAARLLEKIEPADKTRRELVNQMRRESVRLLTR